MNYHFTIGNFTGWELENAIVEIFKQHGYIYRYRDEIHRHFKEVIL